MGVPVLPVNESIGRSRARKISIAGAFQILCRDIFRRYHPAWLVPLLLLIPLKDTQPVTAAALYNHTYQLFLRGDLLRTQQEAESGYMRFLHSDPEHAARFELLLARALINRGMNQNALTTLAGTPARFTSNELTIERLILEGVANTYVPRFDTAERKLNEAVNLCQEKSYGVCSDLPLARGVLDVEQGKLTEGKQYCLEGLSLARARKDRRSEALALGNLGAAALESEHYDEAVDWTEAAYRIALGSGWEDWAESTAGNLGWAYFGLGDKEKALDLFLAAEKTANRLGNLRFQLKWVSTAAYVYRDAGDLKRATEAYRESLELAKRLGGRQDIVNALEDLTHTYILSGNLDEAAASLKLLTPLLESDGKRVDQLDMLLARGEIAAIREQNVLAESIFRTVERDPASQTSMRLGAEHQLAKLYEAQGNNPAAESTYRTALTTFATAREDLKNEESKLPFLTNATPIYDDYIHFLVKQGRTGEALAAADQSRAQTLAQGIGVEAGKPSLKPAALHANLVARKNEATILFYWLGKQQSYLWAIAPNKTSQFTLPAERDITQKIDRYRKALLEPELGRDRASADGMALYDTLVSPIAEAIQPNSNVVVVCDGALSLLNFETLVVPGPKPHYWIEDANIVSAPSLSMLAARHTPGKNRRLLLLGDAVSPNPDYPRLPMARAEIEKIARHFTPTEETVFERQAANSAAYLKSPLRDYAYIHFVAHGVASRTDPLDSAIILSRTGAAEDSFKLHAREIIQHPIDARLVTISACYGGGTRSYAGEGLVGLSWAFLRAGAHNVIGALWEASDDSTPQLMDKMYTGLADGKLPSVALRDAKLALLHSGSKFREPFYWAPFQLYAGL